MRLAQGKLAKPHWTISDDKLLRQPEEPSRTPLGVRHVVYLNKGRELGGEAFYRLLKNYVVEKQNDWLGVQQSLSTPTK